jgi:hypothetical protein
MLDFWNEYNVYIIIVTGFVMATIFNNLRINKFDGYKIQRDKYVRELEDQLESIKKSYDKLTSESSIKKLEKREEEIYRKYNQLISNLDGEYQNHNLHDINVHLYQLLVLLLVIAILYFILD